MLKFNIFPHLLFYGPNDSDRKKRIYTFIEDFFKTELSITKYEKDFSIYSKNIKINLLKSNFHVEINVEDLGANDKIILPELIKEIGSVKSIITDLRAIIILNAEKLSFQAQQALRRTMEIYSKNCRIILSSNSYSKIIEPILSRCLCIRVPLPTKEEIFNKLNIKEQVEFNHRSMERAEISLKSRNWNLPGWELYIERLSKFLSKSKEGDLIKSISTSREYISNLLSNGVPPEQIYITLSSYLIKQSEENFQDIIHWASFYQHKSLKGQKTIYHLEAFVIKYLSIRFHNNKNGGQGQITLG